MPQAIMGLSRIMTTERHPENADTTAVPKKKGNCVVLMRHESIRNPNKMTKIRLGVVDLVFVLFVSCWTYAFNGIEKVLWLREFVQAGM